MFIQHATGQFRLNVGGEWHCGDGPEPKILTFDVKIEYPDTALNSHGFLIDNLEFQRYFDTIQYSEKSCELLAWQAADHFFKLANHSECRVHCDIKVPGLADIEYVEEERQSAVSKRSLARLKGARG